MDDKKWIIKCAKCGGQTIAAYRKKDGRPYLRCKGCGRTKAHPTLFDIRGEKKL